MQEMQKGAWSTVIYIYRDMFKQKKTYKQETETDEDP